jgi:hypothetical protein
MYRAQFRFSILHEPKSTCRYHILLDVSHSHWHPLSLPMPLTQGDFVGRIMSDWVLCHFNVVIVENKIESVVGMSNFRDVEWEKTASI